MLPVLRAPLRAGEKDETSQSLFQKRFGICWSSAFRRFHVENRLKAELQQMPNPLMEQTLTPRSAIQLHLDDTPSWFVDDEPDMVQSVMDLLRFDYRVLGTTRIDEAQRIMARRRGPRGHDRPAHARHDRRGVPQMREGDLSRRGASAVHGLRRHRTVVDAINQGNVFRYITKPWDPDELLSVIKQAAEQYELLVERQRLLAELQAKNVELERRTAPQGRLHPGGQS